jgi:enoyl-CoA hydratase
MTTINVELDQKILTITLQNGKVNAISHDVISEINAALDQAEAEQATVIITGQPGIFSGGFDLKTMKESAESAVALVAKGSALSRRLLAFPTPVIAACSGHAIAKGAFLLLSCDYRIGCKGDFKVGLNEVAIGMTMHNAGIEMARGRIPINYLNRSVINAEIFPPETAVLAGFLDTIVEPEKLLATAQFAAKQMQQLDMTAHHGTKLRARHSLLEALDNAIELDSNTTKIF